jgi:hypothetical protein
MNLLEHSENTINLSEKSENSENKELHYLAITKGDYQYNYYQINNSLQIMLYFILENKECKTYSKYYVNIVHFLDALSKDMIIFNELYINRTENLIEVKNFILYKITKMLEYIENVKNDSIEIIQMIFYLNRNNDFNINDLKLYFDNIALHIEYIEVKLLILFEKNLINFNKLLKNI